MTRIMRKRAKMLSGATAVAAVLGCGLELGTAPRAEAVGGACSPSGYSGGSVDQATVLSRAKVWVDANQGYTNDCAHTSTGYYRLDCSGFVSMVWELSSSLDTWQLNPKYQADSRFQPISRAAMVPGDALVYDANSGYSGDHHVALFTGWASSDNGQHRWATIAHDTNPTNKTHAATVDLNDGSYWSHFSPIHYTHLVSAPAGSWHGAVKQPSASVIGSAPSAVINGTTSYVFWKGTDNNLWEAVGSASGTLGPATKIATANAMKSAPSVAVTSTGLTSVYWQGTDGKLWSTYYNNGWHGPIANPAAGTIASAPSAVISGNTVNVFWKGTDGKLWEAGSAVGSPVANARSVVDGTLGSDPSAAVTSNGLTSVYWKGTNGHLWSAYYNQGWHGPIESPAAATLGSGPSAVISSGGTSYVFWKGTDNNLWEAQGNPDQPLTQISKVPDTGPLGSGPAAAATSQGYTTVYWQGTNQNLYDAYWA